MLDTLRATFDNGNTIITDFNADISREEIAERYMNRMFNLGSTEDDMHRCVKVEFLNSNGTFGDE